MMKIFFTTLVAAFSLSAVAGELDLPNGHKLPSALIVREDAQGHREVFKAELSAPVTNDVQAAAAVRDFAVDANKIQVSNASELDQTSSKEAWFFGYNPYCPSYGYGFNYSYGFNTFGYSYYNSMYYYSPCYSNWYGGYRWNYFWY